MNKNKIGDRLIKLRGSRTQKEIAKAVGVEPMAISYYESGKRIPRDEIKKKLANYYNVTVQDIFFDD
ncbi:MAG: helix-turn-helix transcriptional regulator [Candidatus Alectryocaccobium sp.]